MNVSAAGIEKIEKEKLFRRTRRKGGKIDSHPYDNSLISQKKKKSYVKKIKLFFLSFLLLVRGIKKKDETNLFSSLTSSTIDDERINFGYLRVRTFLEIKPPTPKTPVP